MNFIDTHEIVDRVKAVLVKVSYQLDLTAEAIQPETNLILDLGLTSLTFIDLAVELEDRLSINEFPLQEFIDQENERGEVGFRVKALVEFCQQIVCSSPQM